MCPMRNAKYISGNCTWLTDNYGRVRTAIIYSDNTTHTSGRDGNFIKKVNGFKEIKDADGNDVKNHSIANKFASKDDAGHLLPDACGGPSCAINIVPTSTGAAKAIGKVIPSLDGKLAGGALRVPVQDGSLVDLSLELLEKVTEEEVNSMFLNNVNDTLKATYDPIVSSDIIGNKCGSLVDLSLTKVLESDGKQMVKVVAWYDNEMGYSMQMVRTAKRFLSK